MESRYHQYRIGTEDGNGRFLELAEEPELPQGTWHFGEGTIHHHAFDVIDAENQQTVKDWLVGLGFTDVSEAKDRGYFVSMYCRSPGGLLVELLWSTPEGFLVDESAGELGTHMCIPHYWGSTAGLKSPGWSRSTRSRRLLDAALEPWVS